MVKTWGLAVVVLVAFAVGVTLTKGPLHGLALCGFSLLVLVVAVTRGKRRAAQSYQAPDLDGMLAGLARVEGRPMPGVKHLQAAMRASMRANACVLHLQPERAERELALVEWHESPGLQRMRDQVRTLICYARGEWQAGVDLAVSIAEADKLSAVDRLPFEVLAAVGRVFLGTTTQRDETALDRGFDALPLGGQLLAAWGLAALGGRSGQRARTFIRKRAPHCGLLQRRPA